MQKKRMIAITLSLMLLCAFGVYALAADSTSKAVLSPGLSILENRTAMIKTGIRGYEISFSSDDFTEALGVKEIDGIKITALPDVSDGVLKLGAIDVLCDQTISASALSSLRFLPGESENAEFEFIPVGTESAYNIKCSLYVLKEMNFAPEAENTAWKTEKNISIFSSLSAEDPEGDRIVFEIYEEPKHGSVFITDAQNGSIRYTPQANYRGSDSFSYTVRDQYGNQSSPATVRIQIEKSSGISYCDMESHWGYYAAVKMTKAGVIGGETIGTSTYFYPDRNVSREDFVVMAMKALGYDDYIALSTGTPFADDSAISTSAKPYLSVAYRLGIVNGFDTDAGLCFAPEESITRAEAATVLAKLMDLGKPVSTLEFSDSEAVPAWAKDSLAALCENGIISGTGDGNLSPFATLSRAETAQLLYRASEFEHAN